MKCIVVATLTTMIVYWTLLLVFVNDYLRQNGGRR